MRSPANQNFIRPKGHFLKKGVKKPWLHETYKKLLTFSVGKYLQISWFLAPFKKNGLETSNRKFFKDKNSVKSK